MQCYTELLPPMGVTQSLFAHFVSPDSNNLIVAKTSLLQIYDLVSVGPELAGQGTTAHSASTSTTKLVLIAEYKLPGVVADIGRAKILDTKTGGDALLVSVRDAKVSLIEWDPEIRGISTISIHYYEREDLNWNPWAPDLSKCPTKLSVDPGNRCAMLNFAQKKLAILPFRHVGDDLIMDDFDAEFGADEPMTDADAAQTPKAQSRDPEKPLKGALLPSFVLPIMELDSNINHPVDITFLHEYREPTFGILYSQTAPSSSMYFERKDVMIYSVVTLDLDQRESTTLVSVPRLPSDLFKVVSLPLPVGGALLIGSNEILHIDQSGRANAVGVNDYAKQVSSFSTLDQSYLGLRLEYCIVEQLRPDNGEMLVVLADGSMAVLSFKMDGRSVSQIFLTVITDSPTGSIPRTQPSCSSFLGSSILFLGSEEGDSILIGLSSTTTKISGKRLRNTPMADDGVELGTVDEEEDDGDEDMYEDDLYASDAPREAGRKIHQTSTEASSPETYVLREHDRLLSIGPMSDTTFARPSEWHNASKTSSHSISPELELVTTQGRGSTGSLSVLRRALDPLVEGSFECPRVTGAWSVSVEGEQKKDSANDSANYNRYLILAKEGEEDAEESIVYTISPSGLEEYKAPQFNPNGLITIDIIPLAEGRRIVQVLNGEVRTYDSALELSQIYPVWDEDNEEDHPALSVTFADPYFVIIRDNHSVLILQSDKSGDLDEVEAGEVITSERYISASLYRDSNHFFVPKDETQEDTKDTVLLFLLREDGQFSVFHLPNLTEPIYTIPSIDFLPLNLSTQFTNKRQAFSETIVEILVAELGDSINHVPQLILRTESDDLVVYEPYHPSLASQDATSIQFRKVTDHSLPSFFNETTPHKSRPMRSLPDVGGYSAVFVPGPSPRFVVKTSKSHPHAIPFRGQASHLSSLHTEKCRNGFVYVDDKGLVRFGRIPKDLNIDLLWTLRKVHIGEQVDALVYSPSDNLYVLGTNKKLDFKLPDDSEIHPEWREERVSFKPQVEAGSVKLLQPDGWSIISGYDINPHEQIMTIKLLNLEVSEITHQRKDMIVVGTAIVQGEDIPSRGCVHVFEIINVVPDPDHPERNRKLKPFAQELVKGSVTGVSAIGGQGFLVVAQGAKCMVRGLKEDGSLLPVAFMDMQCHVSVVKELKGTGLCVMADALKGVWLAGYSEEPYKLARFSKDTRDLGVVAADFLPDGDSLYILAADAECNIHVLQYDPEDPSSSTGDLLSRKGSFHTGHPFSNITLLPRTSKRRVENTMDLDERLTYQALVTSQTGSIALIVCVQEEPYRRLSALQSQLTHTLDHPCSLNPRAFRAVESAFDGVGGRGMIDGNLLLKWFDLGTHRRAELANRVGADVWEVRSDLASISGQYDLEYL